MIEPKCRLGRATLARERPATLEAERWRARARRPRQGCQLASKGDRAVWATEAIRNLQ